MKLSNQLVQGRVFKIVVGCCEIGRVTIIINDVITSVFGPIHLALSRVHFNQAI